MDERAACLAKLTKPGDRFVAISDGELVPGHEVQVVDDANVSPCRIGIPTLSEAVDFTPRSCSRPIDAKDDAPSSRSTETGQRGVLMWFRTGSDSVNDNAFSLLNVATTA